jgi:hypothetical protein
MILLDLGEVDMVGDGKNGLERKFMTERGRPRSDLKFTTRAKCFPGVSSRITHQLGKCDLEPKSVFLADATPGSHPISL